tara:strand:- start:1833 stop:2285 length:453 start_codon:yes stop_codon:yes gene_type:complete
MKGMKSFKKLTKGSVKLLNVENILAILFAIFIVFDIHIPDWLSNLGRNIVMQVILALVVIYLFFATNPVIGILGLLALYEFIKRSKGGGESFSEYKPSEYKKQLHFDTFNKWPKTLEEEVITKMAPLPSYTTGEPSYKSDDNETLNSVKM